MANITSDRDNDAPAQRLPSPPPTVSPHATTSSYAFPSSNSATASASSAPAPAGHAFRRSVTMDDGSPLLRRRPGIMASSFSSPEGGDAPASLGLRRRSSNLSEFSLSEARRSFRDGTQEILNPSGAKQSPDAPETQSLLSTLPLAFALLPALVGIFFEGGSSFVTDVMLLGLVFVFLRYTVTQPWRWYHEAQEVRSRQEVGLEQVIEDDSDGEAPARMMTSSVMTLDEVPEESSQDGQQQEEDGQENKAASRTRAQEAAINELYLHEVLALISCFLSPALGAYLLHAIRAQLSRPSEGLMTDFNITVFLLAAELRPISHALKLLQARTLHLQRIVQSTPVARSTTLQLEEMQARLGQLEVRADANEEVTATTLANAAAQQARRDGGPGGGSSSGSKQEAALVREVRNAIQPELDALNRAMRRYEKKATVLALQTESRLGTVDMRLNDAIALAAAAAKQSSRSQWGISALMAWVTDWFLTIVIIPYHLCLYIVMWPFRTIAGFCFKGRQPGSKDGRTENGRAGRHSGFKGPRNGSGSDKDRHRDRLPSRLSRRYSP
ncbi:hypothetical protein M406DRAFT_248805 [Cryphonectria parasitica EP155]|uniref:Uncharacterized protein n=1 Tax=Cryphonectria parasitica (strain ATCC 38755 / EP155) TaxID=660469 RepID=A0A9P4YCH0_CRYP1|nr:uncharacterized protein M406DRAFT_248805 [Cryphonectria parasitica EP155]KAF3770459.1 hypothetical protein M406DRAFT_248805 [Cryphonectria parasitica EP155]